jgi:hypothetical protein
MDPDWWMEIKLNRIRQMVRDIRGPHMNHADSRRPGNRVGIALPFFFRIDRLKILNELGYLSSLVGSFSGIFVSHILLAIHLSSQHNHHVFPQWLDSIPV